MPDDTPVYAVEGGTVLGRGTYLGGGVISIEAAPGVAEYYQHLDCLYVSQGATVTAGQLIGTSGGETDRGVPLQCGDYATSEYSGGPHIEWGLNATYDGMWNPYGWRPNVDPVPQHPPCGIPGHCLKDIENGTGAGNTGTNLAQNGGFEYGSGPWTIDPGTSSNYVAYRNRQVPGERARDGSYYGATNTASPGGGIYEDVPVSLSPGQVVCGSAYLRTAVTASTRGSGSFVLWLLGGGGSDHGVTYFSRLGRGTHWRQVTTCAEATTSRNDLRIQLYPTVNGPTVEIDDVAVS